jgi:hypothetical protein
MWPKGTSALIATWVAAVTMNDLIGSYFYLVTDGERLSHFEAGISSVLGVTHSLSTLAGGAGLAVLGIWFKEHAAPSLGLRFHWPTFVRVIVAYVGFALPFLLAGVWFVDTPNLYIAALRDAIPAIPLVLLWWRRANFNALYPAPTITQRRGRHRRTSSISESFNV